MSDLTEQEITNSSMVALSETLREYTAGRGSQYLQVIIADEQTKQNIEQVKKQIEETKRLNESVGNLTDNIEENNDIIGDNNNAIKDNTKANKDTAKSLKEHGISWSAVIKKSVDTLAKSSAYVYERALREVELTQKVSEANVMYSKSAKELNNYATAMNMNLDDYTQFMKENASEYNAFQRVFKDAVIGEGIQWNKIAAQSNATQSEMNKALSAYTKMVNRNGDINSMTIDQFNEGASEYIKETKLLANALGVSTDAIIKQTEQAEKQWQLDLLMSDPSKREAVMAAQAAGHSIDQIMYEFTGVINENFAAQMATNKQIAIEAQHYRQEQQQGNLQTQRDFLEVSKAISQREDWNRANAENERRFADQNFQATIGYWGQEGYNTLGIGASKQSAATIKNVGANYDEMVKAQEKAEAEGKEGPYETMASIVDFNSKIVENQNKIETLLMPGSNLSNTLNTMSKTMGLVNQGIGKLEGILSANWAQTILQGLTLGGMLFSSFGPFINGSLRAFNWLPKLGELGNIGKTLSGLGGNILGGLKGLFTPATLGPILAGTAAFAVGGVIGKYLGDYVGEKIGEDLGKNEGTQTKASIVNSMTKEERAKYNQWLQDTGKWKEWAQGYSVEEGILWDSKNDFDYKANFEEFKKAQKDNPNKYTAIQENKPANIADSQVQNKADIQAEAKIKADAEQEVIKSKEEQQQKPEEIHIDNVVRDDKTKTVKLLTEDDMQTKLSQMVSLMTEMTNQLALMSSQIPMNNYSQVS